MDGMMPQVVEQVNEGESAQQEVVDLSTSELGRVGAGMCDPGIIIIEK
jgi:hypothetical protein